MLHNLLPPLEKKAIQTEYMVRLGTVSALLLAAAVSIGVVTLLPTYLSLSAEVDAVRTGVPVEQGEVATSTLEQGGDADSLQTLRHTIGIFENTQKEDQVSQLITTVLAVRPDTITIGGIVYDRGAKTLTIEGVSATRDALVGYARSLEDTPTFARVPLSIADLAKNTNIRFRLSLRLEDFVE